MGKCSAIGTRAEIRKMVRHSLLHPYGFGGSGSDLSDIHLFS